MLELVYGYPILEWLLAVCISLYGLNTVISFVFTVPALSKYDEVLVPYCAQNYIFWLLTSVIFFLYGIFLLTNIRLVYLMFTELIVLLMVFVWFLGKKLKFIKERHIQLKRSKEKKQFLLDGKGRG